MHFKTSDLCDHHATQHHLQIAEPLFKIFGGKTSFTGRIATLKTLEDNVLLKRTLEEDGSGRVLVVDGGGSHRCALLDRSLAELACQRNWEGLVIYGCIRHSVELVHLPIGIRALHAHPLHSHQRGGGDRDILISFASVNFRSDHYIYVDEDGMVVAERELV